MREKIDKQTFVNDFEINTTTWVCDANDLLWDIKVLMREYYVGTFNKKGNYLVVKFNNGQKFRIAVAEIK